MGNKIKNIKKKNSSQKINESNLSEISFANMVNFLIDSNKSKRRKGNKHWKIKSIDDHEWMFVEPLELDSVYEDFDRGCELLEQGSISQAEKLFRDVVHKAPLHIDALHHLAIILDGMGKSKEARKLWNKGVEIGRSAFPKKFESGDQLDWSWLENRPFLRCLHGLATATLSDGDIVKATNIFEELISFNPNDNQGIRELLMYVYFEQNNLEKAIELCKRYPNDFLAGLCYGYPLILFKMGKKEQATKALIKAFKKSLKIGKELIKKSHKKPQSKMLGYISVGGWDEAYDYWERFGHFWDKQALEWLKNIINESSK
jgi:tetratricopeptide (TPR) repeat protein